MRYPTRMQVTEIVVSTFKIGDRAAACEDDGMDAGSM